jgi:acetate---CoA ligase (ADP-forming)
MLENLFNPKSIAIVGASQTKGKLGNAVLQNVIDCGYKGKIYPINPTTAEICGLKAYKSVKDVPGEVDLVTIVVPGKFVLESLEECGQKGVKSAIVISAGFRETGHEGLLAERKMAELAKQYGMRIVGPNCLGVIDTRAPYNATFAIGMPGKGNIAFMSQSGALCTSILDIALAEDINFSSFISLGNKADLNEIDFLEAWQDDKDTKVVMAYLEGIADGQRFIDIARRATKIKPMVAIKSGTTSGGSRAVSSHTGTLAGSERAYEAAFKQAGIIRANSVGEMFDFTVAFSRQPLPKSGQVAIITNAGGPGIMATDALEKSGLALASFAPETTARLREVLPTTASVHNPVDVIGDAKADRYKAAIDTIIKDPNVGALLVILTPQYMTEIEGTARLIAAAAETTDLPILTSFMGEANTNAGIKILTENSIPNYIFPERAVAALKAMEMQRQWEIRPQPEFETFAVDKTKVAEVFKRVRGDNRLEIGDAEAREILEAYGIPQPKSMLCRNVDEAVAFAEEVGYPVVMKISSPDILHKTDVGGVRLNVTGASEVRDSFDLLIYRAQKFMPKAQIWGCLVQQQVRGGKEVILGMNRDPQFGPLVMFGLGGIYVEVLKDVAFRIAPFSKIEAEELVKEIRSYKLLKGVRRQAPSDINALVDTLLRISQLVVDFPEIVEMDINPLMVFEEGHGVLGIDMRLVLKA